MEKKGRIESSIARFRIEYRRAVLSILERDSERERKEAMTVRDWLYVVLVSFGVYLVVQGLLEIPSILALMSQPASSSVAGYSIVGLFACWVTGAILVFKGAEFSKSLAQRLK